MVEITCADFHGYTEPPHDNPRRKIMRPATNKRLPT
jgi:hypothetical protein